jgi:hypothetical protein
MFGYLPGPAVCCQKAASVYRAHFCGLGTSLHDCSAPTRAAYAEITAHLAHIAEAPQAGTALRQLGENLGLLIYAQDAWDDWAKDRKRGQFNPLHAFPDLAGRREALLPVLRQALAAIRDAFDALPLRRNRDLLHRHAHRRRGATRGPGGR